MAEQLLFTAAARFEAARALSALPAGHRSRLLHGHGFVANAWATAEVMPPQFRGDEAAALQRRLAQAVAPLDHASLNTALEEPSDENIARWIRARVNLPEIDSIGLRSTPARGAEVGHDGGVHLWRRYALQSAHQLPHVRPEHKCRRMHGHGFEVMLRADYGARPPHSALGYDRLDALWAPLHSELDHACLNDIRGLENPTSEMICSWIWNRLKAELTELSWVAVHETQTCGARFDGRHYWIWKDATLDSACRFMTAPQGHPRRNLHGHTYTLRLHLQAPLDDILGWTVDFGEVKEAFAPVFLELDHQPLHEVLADAEPDVASLAKWIRRRTMEALPQLKRIDLYETAECGAILSWGERGPTVAAG